MSSIWHRILWPLAITSLSVGASGAAAEDLRAGFKDPPAAARPRVWWHWLDGNVTQAGIDADLAWMQRIGIGGAQYFDGALGSPSVVASPVVFLSEQWQAAWHHAVQQGAHLGLEMGIAGSPGWSESGGPWVTAAHAMKKYVWSETLVDGGRQVHVALAAPPHVSGPYQDEPRLPGLADNPQVAGLPMPSWYADIAVIAYRMPDRSDAIEMSVPQVSASSGTFDYAQLTSGSTAHAQTLALAEEQPAFVQYEYAQPQTARGVRFGFSPPPSAPFAARTPAAELQVSDDGKSYRTVVVLRTSSSLNQAPTMHTAAFAPARGRFFRVIFREEDSALPVKAPAIDLGALLAGAPHAPRTYGITQFRLSSEPLVEDLESKAGFEIGPTDRATSADKDEVGIQRSHVLDLTAKMSTDGTLNWRAPRGRWRVLRFGYSLLGIRNHPASPEATGLEVDKLDATAVRAYAQTYLGMVREALGSKLMGARGLQTLVNDSVETGPQNWTDDLPRQFLRRRGYDLRPWMPVLGGYVVGTRAQSDAFLWDLRRTLGELMAAAHYRTFSAVAHEFGLRRYSESHETGRAFIGDGIAAKASADVPMGAWWVAADELPQTNHEADIRESAAAAHLYGHTLVAAESFTAGIGPYAWSPRTLKRFADDMLAAGVNQFVIHTSVHQPLLDKAPGLPLAIFGQWFTRNETWADQARAWIDYLARGSYLLQQGRYVADILYLYGEDTNITLQFGGSAPRIPSGYAFDYASADALVDAISVDSGRLRSRSGTRYRLLVLDASAEHLSLPVLRRIHALVEQGAVLVGERPSNPSLAGASAQYRQLADDLWSSGQSLRTFGRGRIYAGIPLSDVLRRERVEPDVRILDGTGDDPTFVHRQLDDGDIYFINNSHGPARTLTLSLRSTATVVERWYADSAQQAGLPFEATLDRTRVTLPMLAGESTFIVMRHDTVSAPMSVERTFDLVTTLTDGWQVRFQAGRGAPPSITMSALRSWTESPDAGVRYFSGTATYERRFEAQPVDGDRYWVDLGNVREVADVTLNGHPIGTLWTAPWRLDITEALQAGTNTLQVRVSNLWVNRLIGDQQQSTAVKLAFTTINTYRPESPLLASGLLGPVTILRSAR